MSKIITQAELKALQDKGVFRVFKDAQPTFTAQSINVPAGFLGNLQKQAVFNILNARTGDLALGGRDKMLEWSETDKYIPIIERTGQTTPYSDYGMPTTAGANFDFNRVGHYRFSVSFSVGDLMQSQFSKLNWDYENIALNAATEAIAVELNRVAFNGYTENSSQSFVCYGLLNNPCFSNYNVAAKKFNAMTWQDLMAFFAEAIATLTTQSGNNINGTSRIRVVISATAFATLQATFTDLGVSVFEAIQKTYPSMEFVSAIELDSAYNGQNVIYFIGENENGGIADTTKLGYSELGLFSNIELSYYAKSQAVSAGTIGALVFKPLYVVRYTNI